MYAVHLVYFNAKRLLLEIRIMTHRKEDMNGLNLRLTHYNEFVIVILAHEGDVRNV